MKLIAGLGNPGLRYRKTRHNAGFEVIDILAKRHGISMRKKDRNSLYGTGTINGVRVTLVKPLTYMNNSGESVGAWMRYFQCNLHEDLIIISDDVTLEPGSIRIRRKGSAGGHNGLKSIIATLGTEQFARVRVGVGSAGSKDAMIGHVLGRMPKDERKLLDGAENDAATACELMINEKTDEAMNKFNGRSNGHISGNDTGKHGDSKASKAPR